MHNRENNLLLLVSSTPASGCKLTVLDIDAVHAAAEFSIADMLNGRGQDSFGYRSAHVQSFLLMIIDSISLKKN